MAKKAPLEAEVPTDIAALSFEDALAQLEGLVARMEDGTLKLEESLEAYRRGAYLARHCSAALEVVRQKVQVLDAGLLRPLVEPGAGEGES